MSFKRLVLSRELNKSDIISMNISLSVVINDRPLKNEAEYTCSDINFLYEFLH